MGFIQTDEKLCAQCRGRCCQGHPGLWSVPLRFFRLFFAGTVPSAAGLRELLIRKKLIHRDVGGILIPAPQNTAQGCIFLTADGCSLPPATRPCQCLALSPELETLLDDQIHCRLPSAFGTNTARNNWRPWQTLLRRAEQERQSTHLSRERTVRQGKTASIENNSSLRTSSRGGQNGAEGTTQYPYHDP